MRIKHGRRGCFTVGFHGQLSKKGDDGKRVGKSTKYDGIIGNDGWLGQYGKISSTKQDL